jgi:hypothetical protein
VGTQEPGIANQSSSRYNGSSRLMVSGDWRALGGAQKAPGWNPAAGMMISLWDSMAYWEPQVFFLNKGEQYG